MAHLRVRLRATCTGDFGGLLHAASGRRLLRIHSEEGFRNGQTPHQTLFSFIGSYSGCLFIGSSQIPLRSHFLSWRTTTVFPDRTVSGFLSIQLLRSSSFSFRPGQCSRSMLTPSAYPKQLACRPHCLPVGAGLVSFSFQPYP
jgi:hypothetical protein